MKQNMFKLGLKKYIYHAKGYNVIHAFLLSIIRCLSCNIFFLIFMLFVFYFVVFSYVLNLPVVGSGFSSLQAQSSQSSRTRKLSRTRLHR